MELAAWVFLPCFPAGARSRFSNAKPRSRAVLERNCACSSRSFTFSMKSLNWYGFIAYGKRAVSRTGMASVTCEAGTTKSTRTRDLPSSTGGACASSFRIWKSGLEKSTRERLATTSAQEPCASSLRPASASPSIFTFQLSPSIITWMAFCDPGSSSRTRMLISLGMGSAGRERPPVYATAAWEKIAGEKCGKGPRLMGNKKRKNVLDMANEKRILSAHREAGFGHFTHSSCRIHGAPLRHQRSEAPPDEAGNLLTFP